MFLEWNLRKIVDGVIVTSIQLARKVAKIPTILNKLYSVNFKSREKRGSERERERERETAHREWYFLYTLLIQQIIIRICVLTSDQRIMYGKMYVASLGGTLFPLHWGLPKIE